MKTRQKWLTSVALTNLNTWNFCESTKMRFFSLVDSAMSLVAHSLVACGS